MFPIRLKPALERRLSHLARQTGRTNTLTPPSLSRKTSKTWRTATSRKLTSKIAASATPPPRSGGSWAWTIEYDEGAVKDLKKLDHQVPGEILDFMEKRIGQAEDPRSFGERCEDVLNLGGEQWLLPPLARIDQTKWKANGKGMQRSVTPK